MFGLLTEEETRANCQSHGNFEWLNYLDAKPPFKMAKFMSDKNIKQRMKCNTDLSRFSAMQETWV